MLSTVQVRKLYKMLEDPSYKDIVRWSDVGDSFVVLENERFTKSILVKSTDQENGQSPYGSGAWEFKHPEFQANGKQNLDNIRRKAPAPRKQQGSIDDGGFPAQQIDLVNTQLVATQHQLQHLQERYNDLAQGHVVLLQQVVQLQKIVKNHDGVMHRVMGFLHSVDAQRRNSRPGIMNGSNGMGIADIVASGSDDHPASPLQQASELLGEFSAEKMVNKDLLEQMTVDFANRYDYSTPPSDQPQSSTMAPTSAASGDTMAYASVNQDLDSLVYPVGSTNGIDPINSEHIHNIPYALPANGMMPNDPPDMLIVKPIPEGKKSTVDPGWGIQKPRILLVEDDKTCARIGCKFLQNFECGVDTARDGLEAVNKINTSPHSFDLILMDIIMPHLDGVSATVCIREINPTIPIVAMTSNIRADDIDMYFRYGMNDVLPKPFTKEGMLRTLEKHLSQFKKTVYQNAHQGHIPTGYVTPNAANGPMSLNYSTSQTMKEDSSPGKSPASSWHSPNPLTSGSPTSAQNAFAQSMGGGNSYSMTAAHPSQQHGAFPPPPPLPQQMNAPRSGVQRRVISDLNSQELPPDKRQRMYPPPQGGYQQ
ncbi:MAG: kinase-regulated stress-responsive transcription factor skn7 [Claussenomyces sp. TS43310]|nr:MAG: kinase-regulated stress-responsive transcription factor skn7 [Claussenomyces sp. TS43310]